jgi:hypothetical protein
VTAKFSIPQTLRTPKLEFSDFDNDGYGKRVFALVDKKGNVFKKTTSEKYFEDPIFKKYLDVEE